MVLSTARPSALGLELALPEFAAALTGLQAIERHPIEGRPQLAAAPAERSPAEQEQISYKTAQAFYGVELG